MLNFYMVEKKMKKLLITISDDPNMFNGIRFLSRFFQNKARFQPTLLCMASPDSNFCRWRAANGQSDPSQGEIDLDCNCNVAKEEAMRILQWNGFSLDKVEVKNVSNMICRIEDIENEVAKESYDALIMGRRGLNRLKDFVSKSLSQKMFEREPDIPLILCRKPDFNRKDILLCVDDSESAYKMARFTASMLKGEPHLVTLCNITRDTCNDRDKSIAIFKRCEEIMLAEGLNNDQLRHMIYPSDYAPRAILENANWGKFAVVAVGSSGPKQKKFFEGSVSNFLLTELTDAVLWIHP